ncbi:unnamed protein product [Phytophthora lilii]|uniref:Unnamed protein product n=1 Tax=Phytophthora lilii TaxID=2077276 RepID=A0A9W6X995_9STRA|nr:unnamed protein product [Phytophthora lilii]
MEDENWDFGDWLVKSETVAPEAPKREYGFGANKETDDGPFSEPFWDLSTYAAFITTSAMAYPPPIQTNAAPPLPEQNAPGERQLGLFDWLFESPTAPPDPQYHVGEDDDEGFTAPFWDPNADM